MTLRRRLPGLVRAFLIVAGLSPLVPWLLGGVPVLHHVGDVFDLWFAAQCHRDPQRSLMLLGRVLPVCHRCSGVYFGLGLGALVVRPRLSPWPLRIWVVAAALLMLADVGSEAMAWRPASAAVRMFTGLLLAYPVGVALVQAVRDAWGTSDPELHAQ